MEIAALVIGKHNSRGLPGKNYMKLLNRPIVEYPLMAAHTCAAIEKIFVSTDSQVIADIALPYDVVIIDRPCELAQSESPTEYVFQHAYEYIRREYGPLKYLCLLFANSVDTLPEYFALAIEILNKDLNLDSVVSVSKYNMFTPLRAFRLASDQSINTVFDLKKLGIPNTFNRDAMGDIYFCDFGVQVVRPERCLIDATAGELPFRWLGNKKGAIAKDYGFDIDEKWQIPVLEYWLREHGFSESHTPYSNTAHFVPEN